MKIHVKMIGPLIYDVGFSEKDLEIPERTTAEMLMELISVSKQRPKIVTRNGKAVAPHEELAEGDRIAVSPIYSGG
ncbi:MAG: MoaD/ThiS family protein [Candidatus Aminicenantes bacterium]|jgi:sulfur carrier protein ThiS|nr:MoaD/ThiS family protein [Candidatus Aminicenantes bacterium]